MRPALVVDTVDGSRTYTIEIRAGTSVIRLSCAEADVVARELPADLRRLLSIADRMATREEAAP